MKKIYIILSFLISTTLHSQNKKLEFENISFQLSHDNKIIENRGDSSFKEIKFQYLGEIYQLCVEHNYVVKYFIYTNEMNLKEYIEYDQDKKTSAQYEWHVNGCIRKITKYSPYMDSFWIYTLRGELESQGQYLNDSSHYLNELEIRESRINNETGIAETVVSTCNRCPAPHGVWSFYVEGLLHKTFTFNKGKIVGLELGQKIY